MPHVSVGVILLVYVSVRSTSCVNSLAGGQKNMKQHATPYKECVNHCMKPEFTVYCARVNVEPKLENLVSSLHRLIRTNEKVKFVQCRTSLSCMLRRTCLVSADCAIPGVPLHSRHKSETSSLPRFWKSPSFQNRACSERARSQ